MRTIHTEVGIMAPATRVWAVLAAADQWHEWNPFARVTGGFVPGARVAVTITPPGKGSSSFSPTVVKVEPGREIRWRGSLGVRNLFDGEHGFRITPETEGRCRFEQFEMFTGVLVTPILWLVGDATQRGFEAMNLALKNRAEGIHKKSTASS